MTRYGHFEDILRDVGSLGVYQWFIYGLMQYSNVLQTLNQNFMAFGKIEPPWRCGGERRVDEMYGNSSMVFFNESKLETSSCPNFTQCTPADEHLVFYSQVRDWDLYCERSYIPMFIVSMQMLGIIPGSILFNHLIDNYGRKWSCHLLNVGVLIVALSSAFAQSWQLFAALRFLIGCLFGGLFLVTVVAQMEIIKENDRMWLYALDGWSVSNGILALIAYFAHDWRTLIIVSNCVCIPLVFLCFFMKESPRWLIQKGRYEEAADVLNHMARWNRKKVRIEARQLIELIHFRRRLSITTGKPDELVREEEKKKKRKQFSLLDIFHTRQSTIHFLTLSYAWMATACMSYGLVYQNTAYTGSPFVNYAVAACFRVVTQIILFVADKYVKVRRRVLYLVSLGIVLTMLSIMTVIIISADPKTNHTAATALRIVGLLCSGAMSALWLIVYLLPIEIFPTVIRNIAMGGCSVMARIGAVLGPQLLYLQNFWAPTPFVGFTIVAAINFVSVFFTLPETSGTSLPDSLGDSLKKADDPEEQRMLERTHEETVPAVKPSTEQET